MTEKLFSAQGHKPAGNKADTRPLISSLFSFQQPIGLPDVELEYDSTQTNLLGRSQLSSLSFPSFFIHSNLILLCAYITSSPLFIRGK